MPNLASFTQAYIEAALWSSTDNADDSGGAPLDENYDVSDIAPETLRGMIKDCKEFRTGRTKKLLAEAKVSDAAAGHDFWLTRNRHGAGFWDRGLGKVGDLLTTDAHAYGGVDLYVGDDGKIYSN
jgi:hypothetical protein